VNLAKIFIPIITILFFLSCSVQKTAEVTGRSSYELDSIQGEFLVPVSLYSSSQAKAQKVSSKYNLKRLISSDSVFNEIYYNRKLIYKSSRIPNSLYISEVYDEAYFVISRYINKGAAGPELMIRDLIYIKPLSDDTPIYKLILDNPIQFTLHKSLLDYWKNSQTEIFCIDNFTKNMLILLDNKLNYKFVPLEKIEGILIIE
jgi:hypothetical protein